MTVFYLIEENTNDYNFETKTYNTYELVRYSDEGRSYQILTTGDEQHCKDFLGRIENGN